MHNSTSTTNGSALVSPVYQQAALPVHEPQPAEFEPRWPITFVRWLMVKTGLTFPKSQWMVERRSTHDIVLACCFAWQRHKDNPKKYPEPWRLAVWALDDQKGYRDRDYPDYTAVIVEEMMRKGSEKQWSVFHESLKAGKTTTEAIWDANAVNHPQ